MEQHDLFGAIEPAFPDGFRYAPDVIPDDLQQALLEKMPGLPFKAFDFHGFEGKRRTVSYGWKYDFDTERVRKGEDIPPFLFPVRAMAGSFAGIDPNRLEQALVTEYGPGAPIGWHKDKFVFGRVVGISLLSPCTFRLRRRQGGKWQRSSVIVEPRIGLCDGRRGQDPLGAFYPAGRSASLFDHLPRTKQRGMRSACSGHITASTIPKPDRHSSAQ